MGEKNQEQEGRTKMEGWPGTGANPEAWLIVLLLSAAALNGVRVLFW